MGIVKTLGNLSRSEIQNIEILRANDLNLIEINEHLITIEGKIIFTPSIKILEIIFQAIKNTPPKLVSFVKYMKNKGKFKMLYAVLDDGSKTQFMGAILGDKT